MTTNKPSRAGVDASADAAGKIIAARAARARARLRARAADDFYEQTIATAVSSRPLALDWYDHPGALSRPDALDAGGLRDGPALDRLMRRVRDRAQPPPRRSKPAR